MQCDMMLACVVTVAQDWRDSDLSPRKRCSPFSNGPFDVKYWNRGRRPCLCLYCCNEKLKRMWNCTGHTVTVVEHRAGAGPSSGPVSSLPQTGLFSGLHVSSHSQNHLISSGPAAMPSNSVWVMTHLGQHTADMATQLA